MRFFSLFFMIVPCSLMRLQLINNFLIKGKVTDIFILLILFIWFLFIFELLLLLTFIEYFFVWCLVLVTKIFFLGLLILSVLLGKVLSKFLTLSNRLLKKLNWLYDFLLLNRFYCSFDLLIFYWHFSNFLLSFVTFLINLKMRDLLSYFFVF